jgi:hypothetical protein
MDSPISISSTFRPTTLLYEVMPLVGVTGVCLPFFTNGLALYFGFGFLELVPYQA